MPICDQCPVEKRSLFKDLSNDPKALEAFSVPVRVVVIHKPSNQNVTAMVKLKDVRKFAEQAVKKFMAENPMVGGRMSSKQDFVIVEFGRTNQVRVTTLEDYGTE